MRKAAVNPAPSAPTREGKIPEPYWSDGGAGYKEADWFKRHLKLALNDPKKYWLTKPWLSQKEKDNISGFFARLGADEDFILNDFGPTLNPTLWHLVYYFWRYDEPYAMPGRRALGRSKKEWTSIIANLEKAKDDLENIIRPLFNFCGPRALVDRLLYPSGDYNIRPMLKDLDWVILNINHVLTLKKNGVLQVKGKPPDHKLGITLLALFRIQKKWRNLNARNRLLSMIKAGQVMETIPDRNQLHWLIRRAERRESAYASYFRQKMGGH